MIDKEKKTEYWNHFTDESYKSYRPKKITDIRLKQIKEIVLGDDALWRRFISIPETIDKTPVELKAASPSVYNQTRANFWALVREKIQQQTA